MKNKKTWSYLLVLVLLLSTVLSTSGIALAAGGNGTKASPYLISTAEELFAIPDGTEAHYKLVNDIDVNFNEVEPLGDFRGVLNGNGYTIKNAIMMITGNVFNIGLFGSLTNATVENLTLDSFDVYTAGFYVGALAGTVDNSTISNCKVTNTGVTGVAAVGGICGFLSNNSVMTDSAVSESYVEGDTCVGSLSGTVYDSTVMFSNSTGGQVTASNLSAGGLLGYVENSDIYQCYSTTTVQSTSNYVGGLIGSIDKNVYIDQCYTRNTVEGMTNVGGLVGFQNSADTVGMVESSYSNSVITAKDANGIAGGLVGGAIYDINNSYSGSQITAGTIYGLGDGNAAGSFFDREAANVAVPAEQARSKNEMYSQANYVGWDFGGTWRITEGASYPKLLFDDSEDPVGPVDPEDPEDGKFKIVLQVNEVLRLNLDSDLLENREAVWSSSDESVVTVDRNGVVTALSIGTAVITARCDAKDYVAKININVVLDATYLRIALNMNAGQSILATIDDLNNAIPVIWESMDQSVATVNASGRITAVSNGLTVVTASDVDSNIYGYVYVKVR